VGESTPSGFSFPGMKPPCSDFLQMGLRENLFLATAINTEKARSELIIAPLLTEVRRQTHNQISLFSGTEFNVETSKGLQGYCDYLLSQSPEQFYIAAPVSMITEAQNESLKSGLGQCVAGMLGAQLFNQRAEIPMITNLWSSHQIYGAVTSGTSWRFLILEDRQVRIDAIEYFINQVDKILGILLQPFDWEARKT
jgi:hypothetical protein